MNKEQRNYILQAAQNLINKQHSEASKKQAEEQTKLFLLAKENKTLYFDYSKLPNYPIQTASILYPGYKAPLLGWNSYNKHPLIKQLEQDLLFSDKKEITTLLANFEKALNEYSNSNKAS